MQKIQVWHLATYAESNGYGNGMPPPPQHIITSAGVLVLEEKEGEHTAQFLLAATGPLSEKELVHRLIRLLDEGTLCVTWRGDNFVYPVLTCRAHAHGEPLGAGFRDTPHYDVHAVLHNLVCGDQFSPPLNFCADFLGVPPRGKPETNGALLPADCLLLALTYLRLEFIEGNMEEDTYHAWLSALRQHYSSAGPQYAPYF